jgi:uncharacterized membrane protein YesL
VNKVFIESYYDLCVWITKFAYLNILWFLFTFIGLGIFGIMPATAAMFAVVRKWASGEKEIRVYRVFLKIYRQEFLKSNLVGYTVLLIGYGLFMELQILRAQESLFYSIVSFGVLGLFLMYFIMAIYLFPIFVHFQLRTFQYIKWAFIIGATHPILTITLAGGLGIIHFIIFSKLPALFLVFGMSSSAFILMWGALKVFPKIETKEEAFTN